MKGIRKHKREELHSPYHRAHQALTWLVVALIVNMLRVFACIIAPPPLRQLPSNLRLQRRIPFR
jgi:hypothetical protein